MFKLSQKYIDFIKDMDVDADFLEGTTASGKTTIGAGVEKIKKFFNINDDLTAYETMVLSCFMKAMQKGDANALEKLLKISGEQFAEVLDVSVGKSEKLADIMDQLKGE